MHNVSSEFLRPDIIVIAGVASTESEKSPKVGFYSVLLSNSKSLGYFPIVSIGSGGYRTYVALAHSIHHLIGLIRESSHRKEHALEIWFGAKHVVLGLVEMVPIVGNVIIFILDAYRINTYVKMAQKYMEENSDTDQAIAFACGKRTYQKDMHHTMHKTKKDNLGFNNEMEIVGQGTLNAINKDRFFSWHKVETLALFPLSTTLEEA